VSANKNIVIGITGGVATGKSTVVKLLKKYFKYFTGADEAARLIVRKGKPAYKKIVRAFGRQILAKDGTLNRKKLASLVFCNPSKRKQLERLTHPGIITAMKKDIAAFKKRSKIVFFEAPLLFEAGLQNMADVVLVVASSKKAQIKRFTKKGYTKTETLKRINSQLPMKDKIKKADIVIYNNGSLKELKKAVKNVAAVIKRL